MASSSEIAAIRELQRTAAQSGVPLTFRDAKAQAGQQDLAQENLQKLFSEITALNAKLAALEARHDRLRIEGREFSGQGDNIAFNSRAVGGDAGLPPSVSLRTVTVFANGVLAEMDVEGTLPVTI